MGFHCDLIVIYLDLMKLFGDLPSSNATVCELENGT